MPNRRWLWIGSGVLTGVWAALVGAVLWAHHSLNRNPPTPLAAPAMATLWDAPPFAFTDQDGRPRTDRDLRGHPYVADFIFTTCTTACPTLTAKLALLRRQITSADVRFVSFSVDPVHDTPAALKSYAAQWGDPDPRWRLLSTDQAGLAAVVRGMKVTVEPTGDADNPILHTTLFMLVDANGTVRGAYDSTDADQLAKLAKDVESLSTHFTVNLALDNEPDAIARGRTAYAALGCAACHAQPRVAPPLASVSNSMVRLSDGTTVWADSAYLHESITSPATKLVAGYLNTMPSYRGHLTDGQAGDLVAYIESLSTNPPGGHGVALVGRKPTTQATVVVDPVCHMKVAVNPAGPHVTFNGQTYQFCSDGCRERFDRDPGKFVAILPTSVPRPIP